MKVIKRYTYDWRKETEYRGHNITLNFLMIVVVSINKNNCLSLCKLLSDNNIYLFRLLYNNNPLLEKNNMTEKGLLHTHVIIKSVWNKAILFSWRQLQISVCANIVIHDLSILTGVAPVSLLTKSTVIVCLIYMKTVFYIATVCKFGTAIYTVKRTVPAWN